MSAISGIYKIHNVITGKSYVGSAANINRRWADHKKGLRSGKHHSQKLQHSWNKYGSDAFVFVVLEAVACKTNLFTCEQKWMDELNSCSDGYNILPKAGSMAGNKPKPASIEKTRLALKGRKMPDHVKEALRAANTGRSLSDSHKAKLAITSSHKRSPESIKKTADGHRGQKRSVESRRRMSNALIGNKHLVGFVHSDATKSQISLARKGVATFTKLNSEKVVEIRNLYASGENKESIGRKYGVTGACVGHIISGRTWNSVPNTSVVFDFDQQEREAVRYVAPKRVKKETVDADTGEILEAA